MSHPVHPLAQILSQLPVSLRKYACIAGGAAVDFDKATDVDVYIMNYHGLTDAVERREAILELFEQPKTVATASVSNAMSEDTNLKCAAPKEYAGTKIVKEIVTGKKPIQIMDTDAKTPQEVLAKFDLSTHALAYTYDGNWISRPDSNIDRTSESPRLGYVHDPVATWGRYFKLCKRYNLPLSFETLVVLFHMKGKQA